MLNKRKNSPNLFLLFLFLLFTGFPTLSSATLKTTDKHTEFNLRAALKSEISKIYTQCEIDLIGKIQWEKGIQDPGVTSIKILGDDGRGNIRFSASSEDIRGNIEGWIAFSAWIESKTAVRRIRPGEMLTSDLFINRKVNVATGSAREYRGVIFSSKGRVSNLEAIQTILEGQFLVSSAVQQVPDLRRGDVVQVRLKSGTLTLSTQGTAEEPGYLRHRVRVITEKYKKELLGELLPGGVVEVKL